MDHRYIQNMSEHVALTPYLRSQRNMHYMSYFRSVLNMHDSTARAVVQNHLSNILTQEKDSHEHNTEKDCML